MAEGESEILRKLERIIERQDNSREDIASLRERMSSLEMMLGTQMVRYGQLQQRLFEAEAIAREIRAKQRAGEPPVDIH